jgi:hypothetical protein
VEADINRSLQEFRHMIRMGQTGVAKKIFKIKPEVE